MNVFKEIICYIYVAIIAAAVTVFMMNEVYAYTLIDTDGNYISSESLINGALPKGQTALEQQMTMPTFEVGIAPTDTQEPEEEPIEEASTTSTNIYSTIAESMTDNEYVELCQIVAAEAQTQGLEGQKAVVEVIFNRVLSPEWPNTVHGVLSQKGQFATWKMRSAGWVEPYLVVDAIAAVITDGQTVLPDTSYVYFSRGKSKYGKDWVRLGDHVFGRSK